MQTTITIELDQELLQKAEAWAARHQLSLSEAIAHLLQRLPDPDQTLPLSPWLQSLAGVISVEALETAPADYIDYLEEKYS